jgi:hypothetical protein
MLLNNFVYKQYQKKASIKNNNIGTMIMAIGNNTRKGRGGFKIER